MANPDFFLTTRLRPELITFAPNHPQTLKRFDLENAGIPPKPTYNFWSTDQAIRNCMQKSQKPKGS